MTTATTNQAKATKVVTGRCRISYAHVFEPTAINEASPKKYSCVLLIPKSDKATLRKLREAQQAALENGKAKTFGGKVPANWSDTIHDGDEEADLERNPEYAGHWYMSVSAKTKPGVVDADLNPILDATELYSGCYVRASINAFPFSQSGNKGVSFGLNNLMKIADGDYLGGRARAEDDFAPFVGTDDGDLI